MSVQTKTTTTINTSLKQFDNELFQLIKKEQQRQQNEINLIASENIIPRYCSDALRSPLSNKYSEGFVGKRYYEGNRFIDQIEQLAIDRSLKAFSLDNKDWGVVVQSLSGTIANIAVYTAMLKPGDKILYMALSHGGHLSHGYRRKNNNLTLASQHYNSMPYYVDKETEEIDYEKLERKALEYKPNIIIAGASAYPKLIDYKRFRSICDKIGAILLVDMAHIAGLIAARLIPSPFPYADIVTTTTHKTLRGPRGALIFVRKPYYNKIQKSVFPGCQGGPHNHSIAAIAAAMKAAAEPEFKEYQSNVLKNMKAMNDELINKGYRITSGGTQNHHLIVDLCNKNIDGKQASVLLNAAGIVCNMNTVPRDKSPLNPSGIRIGSAAMTSRGMTQKDFVNVTCLIDKIISIKNSIFRKDAKLDEIREKCAKSPELTAIKEFVQSYAQQFPVVDTDKLSSS
uniref:Serine hydroxymethyltransferase n=1 Tax=Dermatophagoides pteronyssinus TaxID=6956 RepID=A0A6P6XNX5_DERPT|nr:uncharacterized protein LOC113788303 [Dermatophagoides pteronyssinus]